MIPPTRYSMRERESEGPLAAWVLALAVLGGQRAWGVGGASLTANTVVYSPGVRLTLV